MSDENGGQSALFTTRSALILLLTLVASLIVGVVFFLAYGNLAASLLAGIGAAGSSVLLFDRLVRPDSGG